MSVLQFLLIASILDTLWVSAPSESPSSGCGLLGRVRAHEVDGQARRAASASGVTPGTATPGFTTPGAATPRVAAPGPGVLIADPQDLLQQLHVRGQKLGTVTPLVVRVLSLLVFNALVLWSDFGAALVGHRQQQRAGLRASLGWERQLLGPLGPPAVPGLDTDGRWCDPGATNCSCVTRTFSRAPPPSQPPRKSTPSTPRDPYWEEAMSYSVPWHTQLVYIVMLIVLVVGVPRCPVVLENACTFLMC